MVRWDNDFAVMGPPRELRENRLVYRNEQPQQDDFDNYTLAPLNERERQIRRHMSNVLRNQNNEIERVTKKHDLLKAVVIALAVMVALTLFSSDSCQVPEPTMDEIQKVCMEEHAKLNCGNNDKKTFSKKRVCDDLSACLQDPHTYKQKKDQLKWKEYLQSLEEILDFAMDNSWWACFTVALVAFGNYLIQR